MLNGKIFPNALAKVAKNNVVPPVVRAKMYAGVLAIVQGEALKQGTKAVLDTATGKENEAALLKKAQTALINDTKMKTKVEQLFAAQLKIYASELQPAK